MPVDADALSAAAEDLGRAAFAVSSARDDLNEAWKLAEAAFGAEAGTALGSCCRVWIVGTDTIATLIERLATYTKAIARVHGASPTELAARRTRMYHQADLPQGQRRTRALPAPEGPRPSGTTDGQHFRFPAVNEVLIAEAGRRYAAAARSLESASALVRTVRETRSWGDRQARPVWDDAMLARVADLEHTIEVLEHVANVLGATASWLSQLRARYDAICTGAQIRRSKRAAKVAADAFHYLGLALEQLLRACAQVTFVAVPDEQTSLEPLTEGRTVLLHPAIAALKGAVLVAGHTVGDAPED